VGVIFGEEMIPQMEEWGDAASSNFGASKQEALAAANVIATLGKSAGLAGQDLVSFSQEMVTLGGDLASMFGGTTQDAITAVGAALRGEMEPIRRYGVLLDDATLRQKAFEMGLIDTIKNALTPQQKVLAAQASILEQTADAQGDFLRTSDGMANTQREIAAELENVNIELGEKMMPIMLSMAQWLRKDGIPLMREFLGLLDFGDIESAKGIPVLGEIEGFLNDASDASAQLNDTITFHKGDIIRAAEEMGVSYMEARVLIRAAMDDLGLSHEEAVEKVIRSQAVLNSGKGWEEYQNQIRAAGPGVDAAAADMADGLPEAMQDAQDKAAEVGRKTPGVLAGQLREGIDDYDTALEELTVVAENSVSDLAERQKIEGLLASTQLTDALNSDSTRTRLLAMELVNDLVSDYELLAPGALAAGSQVNPELSAGMMSNLNLATNAGNAIVDAAGNPLVDTQWAENAGIEVSRRFANGVEIGNYLVYGAAVRMAAVARGVLPSSEPKDPRSPLRGLIGSGESVGERFGMGLLASIPGLRDDALAMAGAVVPSLRTPSLAGAGAAGAVAGGNTYIWQLYASGVGHEFRSRDDFIRALDDLGAFGDGRLS